MCCPVCTSANPLCICLYVLPAKHSVYKCQTCMSIMFVCRIRCRKMNYKGGIPSHIHKNFSSMLYTSDPLWPVSLYAADYPHDIITGLPDGSFVATNTKSVIGQEMLHQVYEWMSEGSSIKDVIVRLRQKTVPQGYSYHPWIAGIYIFLHVRNSSVRC